MKIVILTYVFFLSSSCLLAQQLPRWDRVYTFDESIIEINTSDLVIGGNITRATFRWIFDQPEPLSNRSQQKYKSRREVFEFNCIDKKYRPYEITFIDSDGKPILTEEGKPPAKWVRIAPGGMMERLYKTGCQLFERETRPQNQSTEAIELEKVSRYLLAFSQQLAREKDFKPLIAGFFVADYLDRCLSDKDNNWFFNLDRETTAKASRKELERFYIALLNTGYLSSVFFISQSSYTEQGILEAKEAPADVLELLDNHPYTARYKGKHENYDYLAENIDSIERLHEYTDLLEKISMLMRKRVINAHSLSSRPFLDISEDFENANLYRVESQVCAKKCLGFPKGTKLFEARLPLFHLQLVMMKGELKIVSLTDYSH